MKTRLIGFALVICLSLSTAQAQKAFKQYCPLEDIENGWRTKTIDNVVTGGIGIMLERFDETWPTYVVEDARSVLEQGLSEKVLDANVGYKVVSDAKNAYVEVVDDGSDMEYMSSCVWNRSNGHKLFAVCIGKPTDPQIEFACFYDYDPQKKTLTPETEIDEMLSQRFADGPVSYVLPRKGKDLKICDYSNGSKDVYIFAWDGMRPVFSRVEVASEEAAFNISVNYKGSAPNVKDFVEALLSQADEDESLNGLKEAWRVNKNGQTQRQGVNLAVDVQNGFVGFESKDSYENDSWRQVIEVCYWNYADKKHKLVAISNDMYRNGQAEAGQYSGVTFYLFDNATRKIQLAYDQDLGIDFDAPPGTHATSHELPRQGKTIVYNFHTSSGKFSKRLTWNGSKFVKD